MDLRSHCEYIVNRAIERVQPDEAVRRALDGFPLPTGRLILVAVGKAGWRMAQAAVSCLPGRPDAGIVITKYAHSQGPIGSLVIREAGHPVPDSNTFSATREALAMTQDLRPEDTVLFLLSGGGSALFELPLVPEAEFSNITSQLLACGADIVEMNTIRKRLSAVKGGRFALHCAPAQVYGVILSDVLGDRVDMIASGPVSPDGSTCIEALSIAEKYRLQLSDEAFACLHQETPKHIPNARACVSGSVRELCAAAANACRELGYTPQILTDGLTCEAKEAGKQLAAFACAHQDTTIPLAFIAGGETVVKLTGTGLGGRNQELALSAAEHLTGCQDTAIFSVGSDGTDGPTDAAGGFVTEHTCGELARKGFSIPDVMAQNDSYHALLSCGGLIITGPTGTNVNDVAVVLIHR